MRSKSSGLSAGACAPSVIGGRAAARVVDDEPDVAGRARAARAPRRRRAAAPDRRPTGFRLADVNLRRAEPQRGLDDRVEDVDAGHNQQPHRPRLALGQRDDRRQQPRARRRSRAESTSGSSGTSTPTSRTVMATTSRSPAARSAAIRCVSACRLAHRHEDVARPRFDVRQILVPRRQQLELVQRARAPARAAPPRIARSRPAAIVRPASSAAPAIDGGSSAISRHSAGHRRAAPPPGPQPDRPLAAADGDVERHAVRAACPAAGTGTGSSASVFQQRAPDEADGVDAREPHHLPAGQRARCQSARRAVTSMRRDGVPKRGCSAAQRRSRSPRPPGATGRRARPPRPTGPPRPGRRPPRRRRRDEQQRRAARPARPGAARCRPAARWPRRSRCASGTSATNRNASAPVTTQAERADQARRRAADSGFAAARGRARPGSSTSTPPIAGKRDAERRRRARRTRPARQPARRTSAPAATRPPAVKRRHAGADAPGGRRRPTRRRRRGCATDAPIARDNGAIRAPDAPCRCSHQTAPSKRRRRSQSAPSLPVSAGARSRACRRPSTRVPRRSGRRPSPPADRASGVRRAAPTRRPSPASRPSVSLTLPYSPPGTNRARASMSTARTRDAERDRRQHEPRRRGSERRPRDAADEERGRAQLDERPRGRAATPRRTTPACLDARTTRIRCGAENRDGGGIEAVTLRF